MSEANPRVEHENLVWAREVHEKLTSLRAKFRWAQISTLGGEHRASVLVVISLDEKSSWVNRILENSRYARFHIHSDERKAEMFASYGVNKFRKCKAQTPEMVLEKLQNWVDSHNP